MKKGHNYWQKYLEGNKVISQVKGRIEATMNDVWLTEEDKRNRKAAITNEAKETIAQLSGEIISDALDKYADAHVNFKKRLRGNYKDVAERAAVMGQAYAQMSDDELLRVFDAKFDNAAERGLIMQFLEARVTSKEQPKPTGGGLQPVENPLQSKMDKIINQNAGKLTGTDGSYYQDLQAAEAASSFARNAATAIELDLKHVTGELQTTSPDLIKRRDAFNAVETYVHNGDPFRDS